MANDQRPRKLLGKLLGSRSGSRSRRGGGRGGKGRDHSTLHPPALTWTYNYTLAPTYMHIHLHQYNSTPVWSLLAQAGPRREVLVDGAALCREDMRSQLGVESWDSSWTTYTCSCSCIRSRLALLPVAACEGCRSPFRPEPYGETPQLQPCRRYANCSMFNTTL